MTVLEPTADEPYLGWVMELRRLERCERGLADAYARAARERHTDAARLRRVEGEHRRHAGVLRAQIERLGGRGADDPDDDWVTRAREPRLSVAEYESIATYHDHLTDFDPATAAAIRDRILPDHERALAALDPNRDHESEV